MIYLKSDREIKTLSKAGEIAGKAMEEVFKNIKAGVKFIELDKIAEEVIKKSGAQSSFKRVQNYENTICITPNDWIVHGIPGNQTLSNGDIVGIDLGAYYKGFHSDMAKTFPVGEIPKETKKFLSVGYQALKKAIKKSKIGNHVGDISNTIQKEVEGNGFSVVREFVGHGVGRQLHEDPFIPGYGEKGAGVELKEGMVLALEVIYNRGKDDVHLLSDGWTAVTKDGSLSGLFELTVAVTKKGPLVLTRTQRSGKIF